VTFPYFIHWCSGRLSIAYLCDIHNFLYLQSKAWKDVDFNQLYSLNIMTSQASPTLAITLVLSLLMSRLYLRLAWSKWSISSCSSLSLLDRRMISSAYRQFVTLLPPICIPLSKSSDVSLTTISAKMNRYGERYNPWLSPLLTRDHSDSVSVIFILASCISYNVVSKFTKCSGYPKPIMANQSVSRDTHQRLFKSP